ncbi:hypothetical protein M0R72_11040 [Candidatus Pacearchaeota archaeon]|jgi:hypothetical protein|nr:hypothetical protein [Candidatus Pacearchaeota archaeon]
MSADLTFLSEIVQGLDLATLEWLEIRIARQKAMMHPETIARRIIIRKR